jgi:hypothetical protein
MGSAPVKGMLPRVVLAALIAAALSASSGPAMAGAGRPALPNPQVVGGIDGAMTKYFTVDLRDGTSIHDADLVAGYFRSYGLRIQVDFQHGLLFARGTYAQAGAAAHVGFERAANAGQLFITTDRSESYPTSVAAHVIATTIDDGPQASGGGFGSNLEVGDANGETPLDIRKFYHFGAAESSGKDGSGQNIALVTCGSVSLPDVAGFESTYGQPSDVPIIVSVDGGSATTGFLPTGYVERVVGTAEEAAVTVYVVPTSCTFSSLADAIAKALTDDSTKHYRALVEPYGSWEDIWAADGAESTLTAMSTTFGKLITAGTTNFSETGDNAAFSPLKNGDTGVYYPASDPNVIAVGDTIAVSVSGTNPTRLQEPASYHSGGGASSQFAIPAWQKGVAGMISTTKRNLPDVSLNGDCNILYIGYYGGGLDDVCGTVFASDTWAGLLLLVDGGRVAAHKAALANVASTLYKEASVSGFYTPVTVGCNGVYCAHAGWNATAGLGVPNASTVFTTLVGLP